jgi:hypothetical protein
LAAATSSALRKRFAKSRNKHQAYTPAVIEYKKIKECAKALSYLF